jgi:glycolate dehydrogenase FAD-binding subunit
MDARLGVLDELRERIIAAHEQHQPLCLRGAGTKEFYGENAVYVEHAAMPVRATDGDSRHNSAALDGNTSETASLDLSPYRGIVDYEPSELVITARCGTSLSEIESALAERGQFLAFEPPAFGGDPTIGGVIAAGLSGPRRMYAGAARDFVLGVTLLDARGDLLRFGGQVMKNVAGFDVSRLLCGSLGILGVITEISLKVLPLPRAEETLRFEMTAAEAIRCFNSWSGQPLPLSGAAWHAGVTWLRLSGTHSAVRAGRERLGGERVAATSAVQWWNALRHCAHPIFNNNSLWRLSVPDTTPPLELAGEPLIDWGGALRWYTGEAEAAATNDVPRVREIALAAGGTALCWKGRAPKGGRFHPLHPTVATLHRRLKDRFDPHGIFNPGRLIVGL